MANVKRLTIIGDRAHLLFQLSISNIDYVGVHNLTLLDIYSRIEIRNVKSFLMKNCTLFRTDTSNHYGINPAGLYLYDSGVNRIIDSTFVKVPINIQSQSRTSLSVSTSKFHNFTTRCIYIEYVVRQENSVLIHNSSFVDNSLVNRYPADIIDMQYINGHLTIDSCFFNRNNVPNAIVNSRANVTILHSRFMNNERGTIVRGERSIYVSNCTFENSGSISNIHSNGYTTNSYQVYITDSTFLRVHQSVYSNVNLTLRNSNFHNFSGGVVHCTMPITTINCTFIGSELEPTVGSGGVLYSTQDIAVHNSTFIRSQVTDRGGALYSEQGDISVTNSAFHDCSAASHGGTIYSVHSVTLQNTTIVNSRSPSGSGGAVYGLYVNIVNSTLRDTSAHMDGGAVYSLQSVTASDSNFINSSVNSGSGGVILSGDYVSLVNCFMQNGLSYINGGAIYSSSDVNLVNTSIIECSAHGKGGAVYSAALLINNYYTQPNILFLRSTFSHNSASSGGVLYINSYYNHRMEFRDSVFVSNEATSGSGGVVFMGNTSLLISNSTFDNNTAATDGGVLDTSFSDVRITHSSLSGNTAENGGVFFGRNYTVNFTLVHTEVTNNAARNESGGVFYVRRFNSNIRLSDCTFTGNHANEQGGVMDIRGVTVEIDVDTIIANNTANIAGDVISACLCRITSHGLEVQPDPTYPMYCSVYDQGNGTHNDVSVLGVTSSTTEVSRQTHVNTETTNVVMTATKLDHTTAHTGSSKQSSTYRDFSATTSSVKGIPATHSVSSAGTITSSSSTDKTSGPFVSTDHSTTGYDRTTPQNTPAQTTPEQVSTARTTTLRFTAATKDVTESSLQTTYVHIPDPTPLPSSPPDETSATTKSVSLQGNATAKHARQTTPPTFSTAQNPSEMDSTAQMMSTSSKGIPSLEPRTTTEAAPGVSDAQGDQDLEQVVAWKNSEHDILQVAIASLAVLCVVCSAICVIMIVLFFMACKKRSDGVLHSRHHYSKVPLTDKDKEDSLEIKADSLEIKEESFMEI